MRRQPESSVKTKDAPSRWTVILPSRLSWPRTEAVPTSVKGSGLWAVPWSCQRPGVGAGGAALLGLGAGLGPWCRRRCLRRSRIRSRAGYRAARCTSRRRSCPSRCRRAARSGRRQQAAALLRRRRVGRRQEEPIERRAAELRVIVFRTAVRCRRASARHRSDGHDCTGRNAASPPSGAAARSSPRR